MITNETRNRWIVAGLMLGLFLSAMDQTVTATAMPTIIRNLGGMSLYSWVFSIYMLTTTATIPIFGKLADLYGRRLIYLVGMALFVIGSALCGLASDMVQLIIFRGIQGLGAGALMPIAMTIIGDVFPIEKRGRMQGVLGAVFGISSIAGPAVGGFITEHLDWHWVFFVNLPFGLLAAIILAFALKEKKGDRVPVIDWSGAFVLTAAVVFLLLITVLGGNGEAPGTYSWTSPQIIGLAVLSIVLIGVFLLIELKSREPIIPLHLFRERVITVSSIVGFLSAVGMFGAVTYIPLFAQGVIGVSPSIAGYILTPMMLSIVTASTVGGMLLTRFRYRDIMIYSMTGVAVGLFLMSRMTVNTTSWEIALYMIILGLGMGPLMPLLTVAVQDSVGVDQRGVATSTVTFFRSIGGALGVSILGAVMTSNMTQGMQDLAKTIQNIPPEKMMNFTNPQSLLRPEVRVQMPPELLNAVLEVMTKAVNKVFLTGLLFVLLGLGASFLMGKVRAKSKRGEESPDVTPEPAEI